MVKEYSQMVAQTLPQGYAQEAGRVCAVVLEYSDMNGIQRIGPITWLSNPFKKWFGPVNLVREGLAGTFINNVFKYCITFRLVKI